MKSDRLASYMRKHCNFICLKNLFSSIHAFCNAKKKKSKIFEPSVSTSNFFVTLSFFMLSIEKEFYIGLFIAVPMGLLIVILFRNKVIMKKQRNEKV